MFSPALFPDELAPGWGEYAAAQFDVILVRAGHKTGFQLHRAAFRADFRGGHEGAVVVHGKVGGGHQPYIAVNAAARVPA